MNVFIETPQRAAERMEREQRLREERWRAAARFGGASAAQASGTRRVAGASNPDFDLDEVPGCESPGTASDAAMGALRGEPEAASIAADAYREEKAFDRKRQRRRARSRVLRILALMVLVPLAIVAVFLVSYALTCILNGASPEELVASFENLFARVEGLLFELGILPIH